jgi:hypothetical protein
MPVSENYVAADPYPWPFDGDLRPAQGRAADGSEGVLQDTQQQGDTRLGGQARCS